MRGPERHISTASPERAKDLETSLINALEHSRRKRRIFWPPGITEYSFGAVEEVGDNLVHYTGDYIINRVMRTRTIRFGRYSPEYKETGHIKFGRKPEQFKTRYRRRRKKGAAVLEDHRDKGTVLERATPIIETLIKNLA